MRSPGRLARTASLLAGATIASRALGLVREIVVAALFGASDAKAAYVIGYYLPFFFQRLLIGGTLSIVLIPTLAEVLARRDEAELRRVATHLFTAVVAIGVAMVVAGEVVAPLLVPLAAPGFVTNRAQLDLTIFLTRINFLAMFFLALSVFATAYLQALKQFTAPAVAPLVFNVTIITGTLWLGPRLGITGLAVAWVAGTAAQFLAQALALRAAGFRYRLAMDWAHPAMRTVRRLAVPAMLGLAILEINSYVGRFLASLLPASPGVNAVAALDYAYEVVQAPIGILAISVATVLFPGMSERAAAGDRAALRQTTSLGMRSVLFLMVPTSA
ncbi:MAG: lipid II flippase MurJ, partial [Dongiaceae bacterium]